MARGRCACCCGAAPNAVLPLVNQFAMSIGLLLGHRHRRTVSPIRGGLAALRSILAHDFRSCRRLPLLGLVVLANMAADLAQARRTRGCAHRAGPTCETRAQPAPARPGAGGGDARRGAVRPLLAPYPPGIGRGRSSRVERPLAGHRRHGPGPVERLAARRPALGGDRAAGGARGHRDRHPVRRRRRYVGGWWTSRPCACWLSCSPADAAVVLVVAFYVGPAGRCWRRPRLQLVGALRARAAPGRRGPARRRRGWWPSAPWAPPRAGSSPATCCR